MRWGELLNGLWAASLSAAVIILTVLSLRALFRDRTPRWAFCLLWDAALVRLLVLTALPSPVSVWQWLPETSSALSPEVRHAAIPKTAAPVTEIVTEGTAAVSDFAAVSPGMVLDWNAVLAAVWLTVGLVLTVWFLWSHLRSRRLYADSLPCGDASVRDWLAAHRLRRNIQVRTSDRIAAPLTYGVLCPVILLPSGMERTDRVALSCVLEHEYQHIRRFDTLRKALLAAALCLYWFNPLVWVLYVLGNRDMELACDEAVTARGVDRAAYAQTLLSMEEQRVRRGLSGSHFSQDALEERIKSIMKRKRISIAALIAVVAVTSITVVAFASAAPNSETKPQAGQKAADEAALLEELKAFGVGGNANLMTYNGQLIRCLVDGVPAGDGGYSIQYVYTNPDGVVDVHTLRSVTRNPDGSYDPMGEVIGVAAEGDQGFDRILIESATFSGNIQAAVEAGADTENDVRTQLEPYTTFGLKYEYKIDQNGEMQLRMSWNGKPVHSLWDTETGIWLANNMHGTELGDGAVDLETVYRNGKLCGLQESQPPHEVIHRAETAVASDGGAGDGQSFEEIFARYQSYGLVYSPRESGMGSLTWNGQTVKSFADLKPDGGAFSYQDPYMESGLMVYTQYGADGNLTGLYAE